MKSKPKKAKRRRGRPCRAKATARALNGVDPANIIDPREVLLQVAADTSAPAMARVTACRALLGVNGRKKENPAAENDPVTALALKLLSARK